MKEIDCRGLSCPQPVIKTKKALDEGEEGLIIIVDNVAARDNVERFAKSQRAEVNIETKGNDFYLYIKRVKTPEIEGPLPKTENIVVYINSNSLGIGDEALGNLLMKAYLKTLLDLKQKPSKIIFINSGVHLTCEGSEVIETLKNLYEQGVEILSCGTCLDFYGLKEKLKVGIISNMFDIASFLMEADRLIRP